MLNIINILHMRKSISIQDESYWKLIELKAKMRAKTWDELIDKIYKVIKNEKD